MSDADELRASAARLFERQNPNITVDRSGALQAQEIGEMPVRDGTTMVVSIRWPARDRGMVLLSLREFILGPTGDRYPSKFGMTVDARVLPRLAHTLAQAMDVLAESPRGGRR